MLLGAHVSAAGGVQEAPARGVAIGCDAIQIFAKNQRQWQAKPYTAQTVDAFHGNYAASGLKGLVVHDSYLINMGTPDPEMWRKSVAAFEDEYVRCTQLGVQGLVFHPGAHNGSGDEAALTAIAKGVKKVLAAHPDSKVRPLVENTAGQGTVVGYTFEQVARLLELIGDDRVGVCLDTQHSWAAGYDLASEKGYEETLRRFDETVGLSKLRCMHLNDSKTAQGSRVDRHAEIGEGGLGWKTFERIVRDERLADIPGILETPGGPPGWEKEIARLRKAAGKLAAARGRQQ